MCYQCPFLIPMLADPADFPPFFLLGTLGPLFASIRKISGSVVTWLFPVGGFCGLSSQV